MAGTKYGKNVIKHQVEKEWFGDYIGFEGARDFNSNVSVIYLPVTKPAFPERKPHMHDFDEYLTFMGFQENGIVDLGAEVEFSLGKEQEKYVFNTPTTVYIPKGLLHGPLKFTRVDKPFMLVHIFLTTVAYGYRHASM